MNAEFSRPTQPQYSPAFETRRLEPYYRPRRTSRDGSGQGLHPPPQSDKAIFRSAANSQNGKDAFYLLRAKWNSFHFRPLR